MRFLASKLILLSLSSIIICELSYLPSHCIYPQIYGDWLLAIYENTGNPLCSRPKHYLNSSDLIFEREQSSSNKKKEELIHLEEGNLVTRGHNDPLPGTWTLVFDKGIEIRYRGGSYFAYFYSYKDGSMSEWNTNCKETFVGWGNLADDTQVCFKLTKIKSTEAGVSQISKGYIIQGVSHRAKGRPLTERQQDHVIKELAQEDEDMIDVSDILASSTKSDSAVDLDSSGTTEPNSIKKKKPNNIFSIFAKHVMEKKGISHALENTNLKKSNNAFHRGESFGINNYLGYVPFFAQTSIEQIGSIQKKKATDLSPMNEINDVKGRLSNSTHHRELMGDTKSNQQDLDKIVKELNSMNLGWEANSIEVTSPRIALMKSEKLALPQGVISVAEIPQGLIEIDSMLPKEFDLIDYVSTPSDSDNLCDASYAVAAIVALEARFRIKYDLQKDFLLNSHQIIDYGYYSFGCKGGSPFEAYRYIKENSIGKKEEKQENSTTLPDSKIEGDRYSVYDYNFVGGAYGSSNAKNIMKEILENGPVVVSFEQPPDLVLYKTGIFQPSNRVEWQGLQDTPLWWSTSKFGVIFGWGLTSNGVPYWKIMSTFGKGWGEDGVFRIIRGDNSLGIERSAIYAEPIREKAKHN